MKGKTINYKSDDHKYSTNIHTGIVLDKVRTVGSYNIGGKPTSIVHAYLVKRTDEVIEVVYPQQIKNVDI